MTTKNLLFPTLFFILLSCSTEKSDTAQQDKLESVSEENQLAALPETDLYSDGKTKLIKEGSFRFQVEDVKKSTEAIELSIRKYPAYISSSNMLLENPVLENKITIRVQSEYFQDLLKDIDQQAIFVNFRNVTSEDVSKEFVDLESRLKTKREVEERYNDILRKKAGTIKELLEAEQQIGQLHEEIEATVGKINFLREQVRYSTIKLEFYQTITEKIASGPNSGDRFLTALRTGFELLVNVVVALFYIWPLLVVGTICLVCYKLRKRPKMV